MQHQPTAIPSPEAIALHDSDELVRLIETYRGIQERRSLLSQELDRLDAIPTNPGVPQVELSEICQRRTDYPTIIEIAPFRSSGAIHQFFRKYGELSFGPQAFRDRLEKDQSAALSLYQERLDNRIQWLGAVGYTAVEEQESALYDQAIDIERNICGYRCESVSDVIALAAFAGEWLPSDDMDIEQRSTILRSISAFAAEKRAP